ncbi:hypothetical protein O4J56_19375 [Nocardiopsis sp. RSe5-2]|uniref:Hydrophobic protein n=1 Tax=Nocardiopsis endophytica TaxID=3018445 RepID=A0ABT4U794_9ACTN|nr:hypothetical protein [Nocardiopsis endophytica]MDA2812815.1 hypothetical protein [Nocardiopsis endophytica]
MGRIFVIALVIFLAFFAASWLFGMLLGLFKWVLIVGLVVLGAMAVKKAFSGQR